VRTKLISPLGHGLVLAGQQQGARDERLDEFGMSLTPLRKSLGAGDDFAGLVHEAGGMGDFELSAAEDVDSPVYVLRLRAATGSPVNPIAIF